MTLHEEQRRIQKAVSNSLAYVQEDPWLTQKVLANAKGEEPVVKKLSTSMILIIVLAALIALTAIAYAASEINQWIRISWKNDSEVNTPAEGTDDKPVGPETITALREMLDKMYTLMKDAPENIYVTVESDSGSRIARQRIRTIHSSCDLPRANFTVPAILPEDDSIRMNLELGCIPEGKYILTDQKTVSEYTLKQYDVDSAYDVVIGYEINCLNGETVERTIHSHLIVSDKNEFGFRAEDSLTAEPVSVPGMEKAVFIISEQKPRLIMIRKLDTPVRVKTAPLDYLPNEKNETTEYCYELITVNGFSLEESAGLFSIQKGSRVYLPFGNRGWCGELRENHCRD